MDICPQYTWPGHALANWPMIAQWLLGFLPSQPATVKGLSRKIMQVRICPFDGLHINSIRDALYMTVHDSAWQYLHMSLLPGFKTGIKDAGSCTFFKKILWSRIFCLKMINQIFYNHKECAASSGIKRAAHKPLPAHEPLTSLQTHIWFAILCY